MDFLKLAISARLEIAKCYGVDATHVTPCRAEIPFSATFASGGLGFPAGAASISLAACIFESEEKKRKPLACPLPASKLFWSFISLLP
jgi:hypothetical protein